MIICRYFEEHWEDQYFLPEVYYPKKLVTHFPWGKCKREKSHRPQQIWKISHITHKKNVADMDKGTHYCFTAAKKYGKCGYKVTDGSPLGESYRCDLKCSAPKAETKYTSITKDQLVLPDGYYIWWGTSTGPSSSMYGSEKLTTNFKSVLGKFKYGQTSDPNADVFFRVGGTLRYRKEICYVIVVHTERASAEIKALPPLKNDTHFKLKGFLDANGRVVDWKATPAFTSKSYSNGSYDHFAFAFYFSDGDNPLRLEKSKVEKTQVKHTQCIRSFLPEGAKKWRCPDIQ